MKLLESPRKECILNNDEMISILGGENFSCPKTYKDGGLFGGDFCSENYDESGNCNDANNYCGNYHSCTFKYG